MGDRNTRRNKIQIMVAILKTCIGGANKTKVVYQSNLNFRTVNPYLERLIERDLICVEQEKLILYRTTDRGGEVLRDFEKVYDALGEMG
ncbi:MAG: winged helix-turn-helix domain-containing protein [Methanotrichaceae archaeon]